MPLFNIAKSKTKDSAKQSEASATAKTADKAVETPAEPAAKAEKPKKTKDSGNLYTNLFTKKKKTKDEKESGVLTSVISKKDKEGKPKEKVLGPLPELERKIIGTFDPSKKNLKMVKILLATLVVIALLASGFFYAELEPEFDMLANLRGPNTTQKLANAKAETVVLQTTVNQKNYLLLHYYMQELSYLSDSYDKARTSGGTSELVTLQNKILTAYDNAKAVHKMTAANAGITKEEFNAALKEKFKGDIKTLSEEEPTTANLNQVYDYSTALALTNNNKIKNYLSKNTDSIKESLPQDDSALYEITQQTNVILQNEFNQIAALKQGRIKWSIIVEEIETITKSIDNLYNSGFFEELGGIQYASYNFDAESNKLTIAGIAKKDDGTTFTLITNLIDGLKQSSIFDFVDNRNYQKAGDNEKGYNSNFQIELTLNENYKI